MQAGVHSSVILLYFQFACGKTVMIQKPEDADDDGKDKKISENNAKAMVIIIK